MADVIQPSPAVLGFRLPPEWLPQAAVWLSWPSNPQLWPGRYDRIPRFFANLTAALSKFVKVRINAAGVWHPEIAKLLNEAQVDLTVVELFDHPVNDVWCRDHGPLFLKNSQTGEVAVTDWGFNAWGGKFEPWNLDDAIPTRIAASLGLKCFAFDEILEGGAIEINGEGQLLTTEVVLLNANRNRGLTKDACTRLLARGLGSREVLWLRDGLPNDDTDGHIDNISRFFRNDGILTVMVEDNSQHPAAHALRQNRLQLDEFFTANKKRFQIVDLPMPQPAVEVDGRELPASYANYLATNGAVLMPAFNRPTDDVAAGVLHECFPGRKIVKLDSTDVLLEGGSIHCLTQQQPA